MKKIGDILTMRGKLTLNTNGTRLLMFDGRFDTGYRLERFEMIVDAPTGAYEAVCKIHTNETSASLSAFDFSNNQEIAWAVWGAPTKAGQAWSLVDPDNMIIQDMFLSNYGTDGVNWINYYIELQKYDITEWQGALAMSRNLAQSGADGL